VIILVAPPAGPAYNFIIDLFGSPPVHLLAAACVPTLTVVQIYLSRRMDQHLRRRRVDLPSLHPIRGVDITLAHLPPNHRPLSPIQPLLGRSALHSPRGREQPGRISVLRLPRRWSWSLVPRRGLLGSMDQDPAPVWRVSNRGGTTGTG
jgi:hypothetical protein